MEREHGAEGREKAVKDRLVHLVDLLRVGGDDEPDTVAEIVDEKTSTADIAVGLVIGTILPSGYRRPFGEIAS